MIDDYPVVYIVFDRQGVVSGVYRSNLDADMAAKHMTEVARLVGRADHFTVIQFELE